MRINVNGGHCPAAPGASGYLDELREDRRIKDALIAELRRRGHSVTDSTSNAANANADLAAQANAANSSGAELAISVHLNAGGGSGAECWHYPGDAVGASKSAAVAAKLSALMGIPNRGAKASGELYWLNSTNMTAILVEVCFVDSKADADAYNRVGAAAVASAIADAVAGGSSAGGAKWIYDKAKKKWWYRHADGSCTKNAWEKIGGLWYLFDRDGWMLKGWQVWKGHWYYLQPTASEHFVEGAMRVEWLQDGGDWYYLDPDADGAMVAKTCEKIKGVWYAFDEKGRMKKTIKTADSGYIKL